MTIRSLALAASAAAILAAAAPASAAPVTSGKLEWTMVNHYLGGDPGRTMLGYFLDPRVGAGSQGSATPAGPATLTDGFGNPLATVAWNGANVAERPYTLGFPAASGDYTAGAASVELTGAYTFVTHGIPITFENPLVTLNGTTGTLVASGTQGSQSGATAPYDRSKTQFTLDLSNATVATRVDGAKVISGIVPVGTTDTFFPLGGRLFGTMALTLSVPDAPLAAPKDGTVGAPGPAGPAGPAGRSALIKTISLARAPFAGSGEHKVKLLDASTRAVLASGTVKKRTLRVMYLEGTALKGAYTLRLTHGKVAGKREVSVSVA